jgi:transposase
MRLNGGGSSKKYLCCIRRGSRRQFHVLRWFAKFRSEDTTLMDKPRSGQPVDFDDEALQALLHTNPRQTTRELAAQLNCSYMTVDRHLHALSKVNKYGNWVPRQ